MIADGRLPYAWTDQYAIKDVQRDACLPENRRPGRSERGSANSEASVALSLFQCKAGMNNN